MVQRGDVFDHVRTKNPYRVVKLTEIKINGEWVDGVIYTRNDIVDGRWYVREERDFLEKFKK